MAVARRASSTADVAMLPTHPTPEATHTVETILDYGCDWKYIVENNLDTPHLYWLHDGSIPPIESLGCNRQNIGSIGLRFFTDDIGVGHIGKTKTKTTKVVRFDAPNIVRHGGAHTTHAFFHPLSLSLSASPRSSTSCRSARTARASSCGSASPRGRSSRRC